MYVIVCFSVCPVVHRRRCRLRRPRGIRGGRLQSLCASAFGHRPAAWMLLYPAGFALVMLAVTLPVYRREQYEFAKIIE